MHMRVKLHLGQTWGLPSRSVRPWGLLWQKWALAIEVGLTRRPDSTIEVGYYKDWH